MELEGLHFPFYSITTIPREVATPRRHTFHVAPIRPAETFYFDGLWELRSSDSDSPIASHHLITLVFFLMSLHIIGAHGAASGKYGSRVLAALKANKAKFSNPTDLTNTILLQPAHPWRQGGRTLITSLIPRSAKGGRPYHCSGCEDDSPAEERRAALEGSRLCQANMTPSHQGGTHSGNAPTRSVRLWPRKKKNRPYGVSCPQRGCVLTDDLVRCG